MWMQLEPKPKMLWIVVVHNIFSVERLTFMLQLKIDFLEF